MTPLLIRDCDVEELQFTPCQTKQSPCFYRGTFEIETPTDIFLETIPVPAAILAKGINRVVVFELKNNCRQVVRLSEKAIFD